MSDERYVIGYQTEQAAQERSRDLWARHFPGVQPSDTTQFAINWKASHDDSEFALVLVDRTEAALHGFDIDDLANQVLSQPEKNRIKTLDEVEDETEFFSQDFRRVGNVGEISRQMMRAFIRRSTAEGYNIRTFRDFANFDTAELRRLWNVSLVVAARWQAKARTL